MSKAGVRAYAGKSSSYLSPRLAVLEAGLIYWFQHPELWLVNLCADAFIFSRQEPTKPHFKPLQRPLPE
jgi:hypothetical protein